MNKLIFMEERRLDNMLGKVIFLITDKRQITAIEKMRENMGGDGGKIFCNVCGAGIGSGNACSEDVPDGDTSGGGIWGRETAEGMEGTKEDVLFVTDSSVIFRELERRGYFVAAFLHGDNREEDLSQAAYAVTDIEGLDWEALERIYLRLAGIPWVLMETERCIIRETTVGDVESFYRIYAEPSITYYMEGLFQDMEEEIEYTKNYIREVYGFYGYGLWSVVRKQNNEVIGRAGFSWREGFDLPELGFVIAVPYQKKGYAYEVCSAIVDYGEQELGFEEIQALVLEENKASLHLCRKLGFRREGRAEDKGLWYERYVKYRDKGL